ncbi:MULTISPECIES: MerR family transcriptional regulator [unclassified Kitasatospora]|uniref:MerR family transcriptional regulator n=1 Tax=unclassified Kitasatospora TaxID=2633591 RepID=UPI00070BC486|nr:MULTISPECIES: MerR family transcriptional regulator [unclassified Kitasatospora]KQV05642.1 hypothetical protein ASC99_12645 [Kitasatospora sp. Root107]KRB62446.1 hypothetical protein ASE03_07605 [Kitasatospora sp. Root187]
MLIGELAHRTGVSPRLLRYYEEQRLLHPERGANSYRTYGADAPATVARIRELLATGMNTDTIRDLLPCAQDDAPGVLPCTRSLGILDGQLSELDARIEQLLTQRALLTDQRGATVARGTAADHS